MRPDYSKSVEEVYYDVAARELEGGDSLLILSACHAVPATYKRRPMTRGDLPSWVPDWRTVPLHILGPPVSPHCASGETLPRLHVNHDTRALYIRGIRIDTILRPSWKFHSSPFLFRNVHGRELPIEVLWNDICGRKRFSLRQKYPNGEPSFFALVQTLSNACIGVDRSRSYKDIDKSEWLAHGAAYLTKAEGGSDAVEHEIQELALTGDAFKWSHEATLVTRYRRFAITDGGLFVLGSDVLEEGDVVVVLYGGRVPFILRERKEGGWTLIGECYVHGMMNGETLDKDGFQEEEFVVY